VTSTCAGPATDGVLATIAEFDQWWAGRHQAGRFVVTRIPFAGLDTWRFDPATGNLGHESGRFFTIEGLRVETGGEAARWQPIINQPEIGLLGIVVKEFGGVLHCLMQAKMEPGNVNALQLSPTVQATRSNYTQVHRGATTRYLDLFTGPDRGEVLVDVLQSEQGAWFWRKRNRNLVVKVTGDVPVDDDFRWIPLHLVRELMRVDNLVNMDARTVLSCMPFAQPDGAVQVRGTDFAEALTRSYLTGSSLHTSGTALSWFVEAKTLCDWSVRLIPVNQVRGWKRTDDEIVDDAEQDFRIIGVQVAAGNREVATWTQPLLEPRGQGLAIFVARPINDVLHVLVQARPEIGLLDLVEMGPTVQLLPGEDPSSAGDPFVKDIATGAVGRIRYDTVLSEEGGRFHLALTRYRVVEVGEEFPVEVPPNYCWLTVRQLMDLLRHGHYLNIEARSLLACVHSLW
jgi:dTDP-4-dehydro-6-deoxy-alpha-D-glucopyranose 2,3-dehydratase